MSKTLSVSGVAALHGISPKIVAHAIKTGALKAEKLPGRTTPYLLKPKDVDDWMARRTAAKMPVAPGGGAFFKALGRLDELPALIARHHSITDDAGLADVVIACACSPDVERDEIAWAHHLRDVMSGATETSGALAP